MKQQSRVFFIIAPILALAIILSACSGSPTPQTTAVPAASATPALTQPPAPSATAVPTATPVPTAVPTEVPPLACTIAFDTDRDGNREVYIMGPDGSNPVNLSNAPGVDMKPAWAPDGSQVAFTSDRDNGEEPGQFIYVINADGTGLRQLTHEHGSDWADWSHDGGKITYSTDGDIYVINADGSGQAVNLTNSPEHDEQPTWSPDGRLIAWLSDDGGRFQISVMNADGSNARRITENARVDDVTWTVDGQLFSHGDFPGAECFNCVMNADGSNIINAGGKGEMQRYLPFWTLNDERVECVSANFENATADIYLVGEVFPDIIFNLTNDPADDSNPDWPANCGPGDTAATLPEASQPADQQSANTDSFVIGYAGDDPSQQQRRDNFDKACEELGLQCVYGGIPDLLAQGVSAIVQNTDNEKIQDLQQNIRSAVDAGVPVFVLDAETDIQGAYSIGIDHYEWARTGLEWMFNGMGGRGDFAFFNFQPYNDHKNVVGDMLDKNPGITNVAKWENDYDRSRIDSDVKNLLQTYPNLGGLWASEQMNDVLASVADAGIADERWPLMLCEASKKGLNLWENLLADHPGFECLAIGNPPGSAYDAVYAAWYLFNGAQFDPAALGGQYGNNLHIQIPVVNSDNLQEWLDNLDKEADEYIVDELLSPDEIRERWFVE